MNKYFKNNLVIFITIFTFVFLLYPLTIYGIDDTFFYSIDPDVVYVTNALLYTKTAIISYVDHPGTPTIMLIYYLFIPLRFIVKYILHQNFIQWTFDNYVYLTYYTRIFQLLIFSTATFVFLKAIQRITKSFYILFFAWVSMFSFTGTVLALSIVPENLSFLLTAVWLFFFSKYLKSNSYIWNILLLIIAGIAIANKFTAAFLLLTSIGLPLLAQKQTLFNKLIMIEANITISIQAFLIGVWPIRSKLIGVFEWMSSLFNHSGKHGTGSSKILDGNVYLDSFANLISGQPITFLFVLLSFLLAIYLIVKKRVKLNNPYNYLGLLGIFGIIVFAKYPVIHYNFVNVLLIIFCSCYFLTKLNLKVLKFLFPLMLLLILRTSWGFLENMPNKLKHEREETVYTVLNAWTPFWSADLFSEQLKKYSPKP